jgi:hypothetical protein
MTVARRAGAVISAGGAFGLLSGLALGVLWWRLAPRVPLVVRPGESYPQSYQPDGYLGADVSFAILAVIAGVAVTIGLLAMRREHLVSVLIAGLVAGGLGSLAMWFVGGRLGSVDIEGLSATTTADVVVDAPLHVSMPAVLLLWPMTAAALVTVMAFGDWWSEVKADRRARSQP